MPTSRSYTRHLVKCREKNIYLPLLRVFKKDATFSIHIFFLYFKKTNFFPSFLFSSVSARVFAWLSHLQWIARSQNMGSNLDPDLLLKKRSDPIPIQSFPIFHWRSFQIFSDPFRSFPIYQPWVFTIFIIVKIYFDNIFGNWYMSKISLHQNIYHPYLILEKLAQTMEK